MNGTSLEKKKKGFALPDTYVIVAILVIFMALMTYVIPAGVFDTVTNESGQTMVDPNSFHFVERTSTSLKDLLFSFYTGLKNNATMIFFVMLVGGYIEIALRSHQRGCGVYSAGACGGRDHEARQGFDNGVPVSRHVCRL